MYVNSLHASHQHQHPTVQPELVPQTASPTTLYSPCTQLSEAVFELSVFRRRPLFFDTVDYRFTPSSSLRAKSDRVSLSREITPLNLNLNANFCFAAFRQAATTSEPGRRLSESIEWRSADLILIAAMGFKHDCTDWW